MEKIRNYEFWEEVSFKRDYGPVSEDDRKQIKYEINAELAKRILPGSGGLRVLHRNKWRVIFAVYEKYNIAVLVTKYIYDEREKLSDTEIREQVHPLKKELDKKVEAYFEMFGGVDNKHKT